MCYVFIKAVQCQVGHTWDIYLYVSSEISIISVQACLLVNNMIFSILGWHIWSPLFVKSKSSCILNDCFWTWCRAQSICKNIYTLESCLFFKLSLFAQTPTRTCQSKFAHELISVYCGSTECTRVSTLNFYSSYPLVFSRFNYIT